VIKSIVFEIFSEWGFQKTKKRILKKAKDGIKKSFDAPIYAEFKLLNINMEKPRKFFKRTKIF
jgi:hypothetical protein